MEVLRSQQLQSFPTGLLPALQKHTSHTHLLPIPHKTNYVLVSSP